MAAPLGQPGPVDSMTTVIAGRGPSSATVERVKNWFATLRHQRRSGHRVPDRTVQSC
jgi:hypothetical protein